jgi:diketogulonate reductase-like aldo/keto reductase
VSTNVPIVTLNNGVEMPILGFGVYQIPPADTKQGLGVIADQEGEHVSSRSIPLGAGT